MAKGSNLTVDQASNSATLNWQSFNIGANGSVTFQQPSSSAVALNRIYDANPSSIFGSLSANGQIYLINANGFVFGATSKVNAAGLIASSLNITDNTFTNGILSPLANGKAALEPFTGNSQHFSDDAGATPLTNIGTITVQNGAQLTADDGGRLMLAASSVQNAGALSATETITAACFWAAEITCGFTLTPGGSLSPLMVTLIVRVATDGLKVSVPLAAV